MEADSLTSETRYAKAPSKPGKKTHATVKVGNLAEDEEYSFDVDLWRKKEAKVATCF